MQKIVGAGATSLPWKWLQETLYPDTPWVALQARLMELTSMSTTFTSLTVWISSDSETAARRTQ